MKRRSLLKILAALPAVPVAAKVMQHLPATGVPAEGVITYTEPLGMQGPLVYSAWGLPPGLVLHDDGTLSGSVERPGEYAFTITASDSTGRTFTTASTVKVSPV